MIGFDYLNESWSDGVYFKSLAVNYNIYHPGNFHIPRPSHSEFLANLEVVQRDTEWYGIYLQDQIDITDHLHLVLGGRYDHIESSDTPAGTVRKPIREEALNPRYGIVFQPVPWFSTYYQY